jgi:hypothetical protein
MHLLLGLSAAIVTGMFATTAYAVDLTDQNQRELSVFGMRAMGLQIGPDDIKNVPSQAEIEKLVATGLNLNGHLCASLVDIRPLKVAGAYEVSCIAYRGGAAKKSYLVDALKGIASEE